MSNKNRYEFLLVLRTRGSEENAKEIIDSLTKEFQDSEAEVEQVQNMDKRAFSYAPGDLENGYFVNFIISTEPANIEVLRNKFKLNAHIYRQHCQKLLTKKVANA